MKLHTHTVWNWRNFSVHYVSQILCKYAIHINYKQSCSNTKITTMHPQTRGTKEWFSCNTEYRKIEKGCYSCNKK